VLWKDFGTPDGKTHWSSHRPLKHQIWVIEGTLHLTDQMSPSLWSTCNGGPKVWNH